MAYILPLSVANILSMAYGNNEGQLFILERAFMKELGLVSDKNDENDENEKNILAQHTLTQLTYRDVTSFFGAAAAATATATATATSHGYNLRPPTQKNKLCRFN